MLSESVAQTAEEFHKIFQMLIVLVPSIDSNNVIKKAYVSYYSFIIELLFLIFTLLYITIL